MNEIRIVKANSRREMDDFIHVVDRIYRDYPQYVPDLESDVRGLFSIKTNPGLEFSDIQPFVAYQDHQVVGRIVGIVNRKANEKWKTNNVRFSMIEFVDDMNVSKALIEAVEHWGRSLGMENIHGPLGVTDFDKEGMLIEDFDLTGSITSIYNPPYYPRHMEAMGFTKEVDWLQVRINVPEEIPARYVRVAQYARENIGLTVKKYPIRKLMGEVGHKVFNLFNTAYAQIFGFSELSPKQIDHFLKKYLRIVDPQLIPIIENDKHEVVGAAVTIGTLAKALQKSHGRLLPFGWFHLLRSLKWKHEESAEMLLIAIRPDYQGLGVNAMFFDDLIPILNKYGIKWAETGPQLEDNVRELTQWKPLKPAYVKRRRCYTKKL
ncbi:MAG: N-acetyltransferase [Prevotella sp.]|nr:N-acetyltransferase [Prevotella sp.]